VALLVLLGALTIAGHLLLTAGLAQRNRPPLTAGESQPGAWCVPCNAPVAVRVPLRYGPDSSAAAQTWLTVCASCGQRRMPSAPVVTLNRPRWRPRPFLALAWRAHRRDCARRGVTPAGCAYGACPRPGWWDCAWYEAVEDGRIRWMFCGARHRARWLTEVAGYPLPRRTGHRSPHHP